MTFDFLTLLIVFLSGFLAFSLSTVCGGGAGLLLMPVLGLYLPVTRVPASLSIGTAASSISRIVVFRHAIRWDIVRWFVPLAIPAVLLGGWLLRFVNPIYLEILIGLFLVSNVTMLFANKTKKKGDGIAVASHQKLLVIGFLAGFLSGITGAVGLLFNKFYLRYGMSKEEIVATRAANEILLHVIKLILYAGFGLITGKVVAIGVSMVCGGLLSSWFMKWGLKKISETFFRFVGFATMVVSGLAMLIQSGSAIISSNNAYLSLSPISKGIESKIQWQNSNFAIEFQYDEGFEYEQQIPISSLTRKQQDFVLKHGNGSNRIIIEEVFSIGSQSFEAYYFDNKAFLHKLDF